MRAFTCVDARRRSGVQTSLIVALQCNLVGLYYRMRRTLIGDSLTLNQQSISSPEEAAEIERVVIIISDRYHDVCAAKLHPTLTVLPLSIPSSLFPCRECRK